MVDCRSLFIFSIFFPLINSVIIFPRPNINGEVCETNDGSKGMCTNIDDCPAVAALIRNRENPKICSFRGPKVATVCCPQTASSRIQDERSISQLKCEEYNNLVYNTTTAATPIGKRSTSEWNKDPFGVITGGKNANPMEFPHMALLGYGKEKHIQWKCGGVLISEKYVLTAAHCIYTRSGQVKFVALGVHSKSTINSDNTTQLFKVKAFRRHPKYKILVNYNDIAVIELNATARFGNAVKPACLYSTKKLPDQVLTVAGWGALLYAGVSAQTLQKAELVTVDYHVCNRTYVPQTGLKEGLKDELHICAKGYKVWNADTCQGDSGGPLQVKLSGMQLYTVLGITAFGKGCGVVPGVYTRVSHYVPWIENIVWPKPKAGG